MALYRSSSHTAKTGSVVSVTITKPSGVVDGDLLIGTIWIQGGLGTDAEVVTPPAGWTLKSTATEPDTLMKMLTYWKRAASEGASWQWSWTNVLSTEGIVLAYTSALAVGDPFSFENSAGDNAASNTFPATSGTTSDDNEVLIHIGGCYQDATAYTPPTSFTQREGPSVEVMASDATQAVAGATGSQTGSYTGLASRRMATLLGLRPAVVNPSMAASAGIFRVKRERWG